MTKRLTQEEFLVRSQETHGVRYDYTPSVYVSGTKPVEIICCIHGSFFQKPFDHYDGHGCRKCGTVVIANFHRMTTDEFVAKAQRIHGHLYDYSQSVYGSDQSVKIKIICRMHGSFFQTPSNHFNSSIGCPACVRASSREFFRTTTEEFLKRAEEIHGNLYDYSRCVYGDNNTKKVEIICHIHGSFLQSPGDHLSGRGCFKCGKARGGDLNRDTKDEFVQKAKQIHGQLYDYSRVDYKKSSYNVEIICVPHGSFFQSPNSHLSGAGCPLCRASRGEKRVARFLTSNGIVFVFQFRCNVEERTFRFDFGLPEIKVLIEFNGPQHYASVSLFGGDDQLSLLRERDRLKANWAATNGYRLIVINKKDRDIENLLSRELCLQAAA